MGEGGKRGGGREHVQLDNRHLMLRGDMLRGRESKAWFTQHVVSQCDAVRLTVRMLLRAVPTLRRLVHNFGKLLCSIKQRFRRGGGGEGGGEGVREGGREEGGGVGEERRELNTHTLTYA